MSKRTIGYVLIALGLVIVVLSLAADVIGIGGQLGFGWKQQLGTAIGVIVALVCVWLTLSKPNRRSRSFQHSQYPYKDQGTPEGNNGGKKWEYLDARYGATWSRFPPPSGFYMILNKNPGASFWRHSV